MSTVASFVDVPGDSPLRSPPADYALGGHGRWFVLPDGPDAGRRLYFSDRRLGPEDPGGPVVVFVHGNPECSYTYRKVVGALAGRGDLGGGVRIVVPDHLGFGRSDQASFEMVDQHHARNLTALVRALDLRDITLVVHDWGGPIGVGALLLDDPERVRNLVVLNSTIFPMPPDGLTYENFPIPLVFPWARSARLVPDRLWGTHAAFALDVTHGSHACLMATYARFLLGHVFGRIPRAQARELAVFRDQFATRANARSSKRMVRQTPVWGHGYAYEDPTLGPQDNHGFYRAMQERIGPAWGPDGQAIGVAGLFGEWDPAGKPSVREQWAVALPQLAGRMQAFPGEGHFIEEHRGEEIAAAIAELLRARAPAS